MLSGVTQDPDTPADDTRTARSLARSLNHLIELGDRLGGSPQGTELVARVTGHLGCGLADLTPVSETFPDWEHVNLQRGVDAYLAAHTPDAAWFGISGSHRTSEDMIGLLTGAEEHGQYRLGAVDMLTVATGPDSTAEVVNLGLVATNAPDGAPVVVGVSANPHGGPMGPEARLDVLAAERATATAVRNEIERLMRVHDIYRGQVLTFGHTERTDSPRRACGDADRGRPGLAEA